MANERPSGRPYLLAGLVWLVAAILLAATGRIARLEPPAPQLVLVALTAGLIIAGVALSGFRAWLTSIRMRKLVAFHVTRFVGIYFLVLYGRGELPYAFAVPGGWGDIVVATLALVIVLLVADLDRGRPLVLGWNILGFVDILFVVATAARLGLTDPPSLAALLRLPLSLLPTFLVPLCDGGTPPDNRSLSNSDIFSVSTSSCPVIRCQASLTASLTFSHAAPPVRRPSNLSHPVRRSASTSRHFRPRLWIPDS